jgi:4-diphosphocytidyl-2-C-methyl-D-erythritol kinase
MRQISVKAPAKINLFLKVLRKREDGFHDIYSWFQAINLFDYLSFEKKSMSGIHLSVENGVNLPTNESNLVVKTAKLLKERFHLPEGIEIRLEKNIPVAAGLGGGSSDAAATIYAVNELFELDLSNEEMRTIGLDIGSDVPFFFSTGQAEVTGRGEIIKDIPLPIDYAILLVVPNISVSTAESYRHLNLNLTSPVDRIKLPLCKDFGEMADQILKVGNDFEEVTLKSLKTLRGIKERIKDSGAVFTRMSGTGPAMFGLFNSAPSGEGWQEAGRKDLFVFHGIPITLPVWTSAARNRLFDGRSNSGNNRSADHFAG